MFFASARFSIASVILFLFATVALVQAQAGDVIDVPVDFNRTISNSTFTSPEEQESLATAAAVAVPAR